jgi:hypothetical protein
MQSKKHFVVGTPVFPEPLAAKFESFAVQDPYIEFIGTLFYDLEQGLVTFLKGQDAPVCAHRQKFVVSYPFEPNRNTARSV